MKLLRYGLLGLVFVLLTIAGTAQDTESGVVTVSAAWEEAEAEGFRAMADAFTEQTGIEVVYRADPSLIDNVTRPAFINDPSDVAFLTRPGVIRRLVNMEVIVPLNAGDDPILSNASVASTLQRSLVQLGTFDDVLYGLLVKSSSKSTFWYKPDSFEALGVEIPETWEELTAIVDAYVADGQIPLALGGGDGWTLTDWFENIYIRINGVEKYNQLFFTNEIGWQDISVIRTLQTMSNLLSPIDEKLAKGKASITDVTYREGVTSWLNGDAEMFYEGGFVRTYAKQEFPDLECGEDYTFFVFPQIDPANGYPIIGGGDLAVVFNDTPEVRAFMQFIASPEGATAWVTAETGAIISPNRGVNISAYRDTCSALVAQQIRNAETFVFDGSDVTTGIFGEYAFFVSLQDFLLDPVSMAQILEYLDDADRKS